MKKRNKKKLIFLIGLVALAIIAYKPITALALDAYSFTTDRSVGKFYQRNQPWLISNNFVTDALHTIGWGFIKFLKIVTDASELIYIKSIGLLDFTNYPEVNSLIENFKLGYAALMTLSVMYLGYSLIISHEKKPNIVKSLFLSVFCFCSLAGIMVQLNGVISTFATELIENSTMSTSVISHETFDLLEGIKASETNFNINKKEYLDKCNLKPSDIELLDINEVVNYSSKQLSENVSSLFAARLEKTLYADDDDFKAQVDFLLQEMDEEEENEAALWWLGYARLTDESESALRRYLTELKELPRGTKVYMLNKIDSGYKLPFDSDTEKNGFMNKYYYRYHVEYFPIFIALIAYIIVYISMAYKTVRGVYELAVKQILAIMYSADINGTQKTMKILTSIRDGYIVIMLSSILIKLFSILNKYIAYLSFDDLTVTETELIKCIFLIMAALAVVDGPDIIQQLTGIDAGLSGGVGKVMAAYHIGKGVARTATAAPRGLARFAGNRIRDNRLANSIEKAHENKRAIDNASIHDSKENTNVMPGENNLEQSNQNNINGPDEAPINEKDEKASNNSNLNVDSENVNENSMNEANDGRNDNGTEDINDINNPGNSNNADEFNNNEDLNGLGNAEDTNSIDRFNNNEDSNGLGNAEDSNNDIKSSNIKGTGNHGVFSQIKHDNLSQDRSVSDKGNIDNSVNSNKSNGADLNLNNSGNLSKKDSVLPGGISSSNDLSNSTKIGMSENLNSEKMFKDSKSGIGTSEKYINSINANSNLGRSNSIDPTPGTYNLNGQTIAKQDRTQKISNDLMRSDNLNSKGE